MELVLEIAKQAENRDSRLQPLASEGQSEGSQGAWMKKGSSTAPFLCVWKHGPDPNTKMPADEWFGETRQEHTQKV